MRITLLIIVTAMTRKERPPDSTEQEDEPLSEIAGGFTVDSNASPHIHGKLACIINDSTSKKLVGDKVKELLEKYSRPNTCNTQVPKINPGIWAKLPGPSKSRDIEMQKT